MLVRSVCRLFNAVCIVEITVQQCWSGQFVACLMLSVLSRDLSSNVGPVSLSPV